MRGAGDILLLSTYELGHQPSGLAFPLAFLERAGFSPRALDLAVEPLDEAAVRAARLVAISVPMHTALRLGLRVAERVRALRPDAVLCFFGAYAPLHAALLLGAGARAVLGGECEEELVALAREMEGEPRAPAREARSGGGGRDGRGPAVGPSRTVGAGQVPAATVESLGADQAAFRAPETRVRGEHPEAFEAARRFVHDGGHAASRLKLDFPVPSRASLPPPERYARLADAQGERLAGHVEATRGCRHRCRHCPLPAIYDGRLFAVPLEVVVEDAARQIAAGVTHLTFGDPDFLNAPAHARRVTAALHARFPALTFDFTAKVSHLVRHAALLPDLAAAGAVFCVSAVESLSERVLAKLDKGHGRDDVYRAFDACREAGISLRPSLLPFTPWSTLDDYVDLLETFLREGWAAHTDPVQLSIRLLVPGGSLLLGDPELEVGPYDPASLGYPWTHPDPRMDALQRDAAARVEQAARDAEPTERTFEAVLARALAVAGRPHRHVLAARGPDVRSQHSGRAAPRLTESWFC